LLRRGELGKTWRLSALIYFIVALHRHIDIDQTSDFGTRMVVSHCSSHWTMIIMDILPISSHYLQ
jgi:hypothetical protein